MEFFNSIPSHMVRKNFIEWLYIYNFEKLFPLCICRIRNNRHQVGQIDNSIKLSMLSSEQDWVTYPAIFCNMLHSHSRGIWFQSVPKNRILKMFLTHVPVPLIHNTNHIVRGRSEELISEKNWILE